MEAEKKIEAWKHAPKSASTRAKISASMRGKKNRRGVRKPASARGVSVCIAFPRPVFDALKSRLARTGEMRSRFVANAVSVALGLPPVPTKRKTPVSKNRVSAIMPAPLPKP